MKYKKKDNVILGVTGLSTSFHDNSAVLLKNGNILFAASEERYSRIKHDKRFPILSIKEALRFTKIKKEQINIVAVGYPKRYFFLPFLGTDLLDFVRTLYVWMKGRGIYFVSDTVKILLGEKVQNSKSSETNNYLKNVESVFVAHHLAHAASAYFTSGMKDSCLAVSMDAFGPKLNGQIISGSVYLCKNKKIEKVLEEIKVNSSIGLFYTAVTQALGFTPGDGEGKTMGLAAYGDPLKAYSLLRKASPLFVSGRWVKSLYWAEMFFSTRKEFKPIFDSLPIGRLLQNLIQEHNREDVAAAAQMILEEEVVKYFKYLIAKYKEGDFVFAGGLFLNVKMNKRISEIKGIRSVYVQPNAGDGGTALGAGLQVFAEKYGFSNMPEKVDNVSWGTGYNDVEILRILIKYKSKIIYSKKKEIAKFTARRIKLGKVIGWFQGRFEWGPRALGNRSVLIDPTRMDIKEKLNNTLKNREWFMPFAPSIMEEHGGEYFKDYKTSPFMTMAYDVKRSKIKDIRAAIHVDNTARPNSVSQKDNPLYYNVIKEFKKLTKIPVILNTSFNKHGLPIVTSPKDAVDHLLWNCIDELVIGSYHVIRK